MMEAADYILLSQCEDRWLYRIDARNFSLGVFNEPEKGFIGVRLKFQDEYLFTEYHWDTGEPFGTVKPLEKLEELPPGIVCGERNNRELFEWLKEKGHNMNKPSFDSVKVIYHASCVDGFCAAWLLWRVFPDAEFHAANYQQEPVEVKEKQYVYIVDFSYPRGVMVEMSKKAHLVVLDHHKTAKEACEGLDFCTFDMDKSGAMLTYEYLVERQFMAPDLGIKMFVSHIQDRDLWQWKMGGSKEINSGLRAYPFEFDVWNTLYGDRERLRQEGAAIERYRQQIIDHHVRHAVEFTIDGHKVLGVGCTAIDMHSEVAGTLAEGRPFGFVYLDTSDGLRKFSLRSRDGGLDVSEIAQKFGGGGHRNAAGFEVKHGMVREYDPK